MGSKMSFTALPSSLTGLSVKLQLEFVRAIDWLHKAATESKPAAHVALVI